MKFLNMPLSLFLNVSVACGLPLLASAAYAQGSKASMSATQPALDDAQLAMAQAIPTGPVHCEGGLTVNIQADPKNTGYFTLKNMGKTYVLSPEITTTGAWKLTNKKSGIVWYYLANKSMLMDEAKGKRLADGCRDEKQKAVEAGLKQDPSKAEFK